MEDLANSIIFLGKDVFPEVVKIVDFLSESFSLSGKNGSFDNEGMENSEQRKIEYCFPIS